MITFDPHRRAPCELAFNASKPSCASASITDTCRPFSITIASPVTTRHPRRSLYPTFPIARRVRHFDTASNSHPIQSP
jgi:hypothetical protein